MVYLVDALMACNAGTSRGPVSLSRALGSEETGLHCAKRPCRPIRPSRLRAWGVHLFRWSIFVLILVLIRQQHRWQQAQRQGTALATVGIEQVRRFYPRAARLAAWQPGSGGRTVVDSAGRPLGYVIQTSPLSDPIIGFAGPTNALIAFDANDVIVGVAVLQSADTPRHVEAVVRDPDFLPSLTGLSWQQARAGRDADAVAGATLTSLAIAEGIVRRLGGQPHSYRFPELVTLEEVRRFFPHAARLADWEGRPGMLRVMDASGRPLGAVARTSPAADDLIGFQGPTDTLIALDGQHRVKGIAIRRSYETPEYVGWVREDDYFMSLFDGMRLDRLASLDLSQAQIEGVSGATMTSVTVAEGLVAAAGRMQRSEARRSKQRIAIGTRDVGTALLVACALILAFTSLRGKRPVRIAFQIAVIVYLGFVTGDMVSQALVVGWVQTGVPWRLAPGLALLVGSTLALPLLSRRQLYCHHLCPHGAAQQLLGAVVPGRFRLPRRVSRGLRWLPGLLLGWVLIVAMLDVPCPLESLEPFHAYLLPLAGWATIAIAVLGLAASPAVPMAYCRYGCPTGAMLRFLRRKGRCDRFTRSDGLALAMAGAALILTYLAR